MIDELTTVDLKILGIADTGPVDTVIPARGQKRNFERLIRLGLLRKGEYSRTAMTIVYHITDVGRAALHGGSNDKS